MMKYPAKKPELLAPAGNIVSAITAFDAGADAIYAGLAKFNARERSENFTLEELDKTIAYAHSNARKVYVALNTIIKESEIAEFAKTVSSLVPLNPDALIVQDIGALRIIRDHFPSMKIHSSTQMGIHNSHGVKMAASLGAERVILERQISFGELALIVEKSPVEIEIFIHGALCCSISGSCLISSWLNGHSGNRGLCRQPCRYKFKDNTGKNEYFMSTMDLCTIENIHKIAGTGVAAFKIEGRLRKNDYVRNTVAAYRLVLDTPPDKIQEALKEAKELLTFTCGRKYIGGFADPKSFSKLIFSESPGTMGILSGQVLRASKEGFHMRSSRKIHLGDRLRIQPEGNQKGVILTVKNILFKGRNIIECEEDMECFIETSRYVSRGSLIYKIGESISDLTKKIASLPPFSRKPVSLDISMTGAGFKIRTSHDGVIHEWTEELSLSEALKHPLSPEKISEEFKSSRSEKFYASEINVKIDGSFFMPLSLLKETRRKFWEWVEGNLTFDSATGKSAESLEKFITYYSGFKNDHCPVCESTYAVVKGERPRDGTHIIAQNIYSYGSGAEELILPSFCPETELAELMKIISSAYASGIRRFRLCSLYALETLKNYKDIILVSSYPFAAANSLAVREFRRLGLSKIQIWPELDGNEIRLLVAKSDANLELYKFGRIPLLVTRGTIGSSGEFSDEAGNSFFTASEHGEKVIKLFSGKIMSLPKIDAVSEYIDMHHAGNEIISGDFNFGGELR